MTITIIAGDTGATGCTGANLWPDGSYNGTPTAGASFTSLARELSYSFTTTVAQGLYAVDFISPGGSTASQMWVLINAASGTFQCHQTREGALMQFDANNYLQTNDMAINGVSTSSVTTVNANLGTTQAIAFDGNNYQKVDVQDWLGATTANLPNHFSSMLISAAGNVGIDLSNVSNQSSTLSLTGTTVGATTTLTNAPQANTTETNAYNILTNGTYGNSALEALIAALGSPMQVGAAVTLAASQPNYAPATHSDATTIESAISGLATEVGSPMQAGTNVTVGGYATGQAPPSTSQIAAAILATPANLLATNSDGSVNFESGQIVIDNYVTVPAAIAQASQTPSQITCLRGDTLNVSLPLMGNIAGRTRLIMTAKLSVNDLDEQAIIQIIEGTGLVILNGASTSEAATASLTVTNSTTGAINLMIDAEITCLLVIEDLVWDVQAYLSTGIVTPISGVLSVVADVTRTVN